MKIAHRKKMIYAKIIEKDVGSITQKPDNHLSLVENNDTYYIIFLKPDKSEKRVYVSYSWNDSYISENISDEELAEYVTSGYNLMKSHLRNERFEIGVGFFNFDITVEDAYGDIDTHRRNSIIDGLTLYDSKLLGIDDLKLAREMGK